MMEQQWSPQDEVVAGLVELFFNVYNGKDVAASYEKFSKYQAMPDFSWYLLYMFTQPERFQSEIRTMAGVQLKNCMKNARFPNAVTANVLPALYNAFGDANVSIRNVGGSLISAIFASQDAIEYPSIATDLIALLENPNKSIKFSAISTLNKIAEDHAMLITSYDDLTAAILPHLIKQIADPEEDIQIEAITTLAWFVSSWPASLNVYLPEYVNGLFARAGSHNAIVRAKVCQVIVILLQEDKGEFLTQEIHNIIQYMLLASKDEDEDISLAAGDFWTAMCTSIHAQLLPSYFDRLLPLTLENMIYSDRDLSELREEESNADKPDNAQDIQPFMPKSGSEVELDMEEDAYNRWNLRKAFATALDTIAVQFKNAILPQLLPILKELLFSSDWRRQECAILALGAISIGCTDGIAEHLTELVRILLVHMKSQEYLIRSISCWTLSRYVEWIVTSEHNNTAHFFQELIESLMERLHDRNKRVQEAACSAFSFLEEASGHLIVPFLPQILTQFSKALGTYQQKNLSLLYDAIATLADSVGPQYMSNPAYAAILMPSLFHLWKSLADGDERLFPLFECLSAVVVAFGDTIGEYAPIMFDRCMNLINTCYEEFLRNKEESETDSVLKTAVIVCVDLIAGMLQGLRGNMITLIQAKQRIPQLIKFIEYFINDTTGHVRQSTIALLGDFATFCPPELEPLFVNVLHCLQQRVQDENQIVRNNAIWASGELATKFNGDAMRRYITNTSHLLCSLLVMVKQNPDAFKEFKTIMENTAITVGRYGLTAPEVMVPQLPEILHPWLVIMTGITAGSERESAFLGFLRISDFDRQWVFAVMYDMTRCFLSLGVDLQGTLSKHFSMYLKEFRSIIGPNEWEKFLHQFNNEMIGKQIAMIAA